MSFDTIFKKTFLESYSTNNITFQFAIVVMLVCIVLSAILYAVYYLKSRKYFFSKEFAISLVALSLITAAIIMTIQSSIVVSLGMVGALSIVRFRTAVKNALDLVFLFWAISIGIICGAGIFYIAILLTLVVGIVVLLSDEIPGVTKNRLLVLEGEYPYNDLKLKESIKKYSKHYKVKSQNIHNDEISLIIELKLKGEENDLLKEVKKQKGFHNVSLLIQEGVVD